MLFIAFNLFVYSKLAFSFSIKRKTTRLVLLLLFVLIQNALEMTPSRDWEILPSVTVRHINHETFMIIYNYIFFDYFINITFFTGWFILLCRISEFPLQLHLCVNKKNLCIGQHFIWMLPDAMTLLRMPWRPPLVSWFKPYAHLFHAVNMLSGGVGYYFMGRESNLFYFLWRPDSNFWTDVPIIRRF